MQQHQLQKPSYLSNTVKDDEIDLTELFSALWRGKWIILIITSVFAIGSVIFAINQPNIYKSDILLAPSNGSGGGGLSKMAGQLGGLAALAGVNIGGVDASQADLALEVIKSRQFVAKFINDHDLLVPLMAAKGWDLAHNQLIVNSQLYDSENHRWLREPKGLRESQPSEQEAYKRFTKEVLSIEQDKESGLYTVSVMHYSPYIAKQWVTWLVQDINKVMRERAISETTQNLSYLNAQLQKTAVTDMKATFYKLIEEQTKSLMLAEVQEEFVFKIVDPAIVPEVKDKPKRALICILGTMLGGIISFIVVLIIFSSRNVINNKAAFYRELALSEST